MAKQCTWLGRKGHLSATLQRLPSAGHSPLLRTTTGYDCRIHTALQATQSLAAVFEAALAPTAADAGDSADHACVFGRTGPYRHSTERSARSPCRWTCRSPKQHCTHACMCCGAGGLDAVLGACHDIHTVILSPPSRLCQ